MTAAQATKTTEKKPDLKQEPLQEERSRGAVANIAPPRIPYHPAVQQRFNIDQSGWRALVDAVWPSAKTPEAIILALSYCKARSLDPFKRPVHIVPVWNSSLNREVEGVWPGIGELRTTAHRTGFYAGCDTTLFGPDKAFSFKGRVKKPKSQDYEDRAVTITAPEWAQMTVWRLVGGQRVSFPGPRIYFLASYGRKGKTELPNDKWEQMPSYMLEKVAEASALRKAFPEEIGEMISAEEAEGTIMDLGGGQVGEVMTPPPPPRRSDFKASDDATDVSEDLDGQYAATMSGRQPDTPAERGDAPEDGDGQPDEGKAAASDKAPTFIWTAATGEIKEFTDPYKWMDHAHSILKNNLEVGEPVQEAWDRQKPNWPAVEAALPNNNVGKNNLKRFNADLNKLLAEEAERNK